MKLITIIVLILLINAVSLKKLGKQKRGFDHDVCILGAGASGMSAAVFLKDRGYNVLVVEKDHRVGGHCETIQNLQTPQPGQQNWMELGVQAFPDTKYENETGVGSWTLGSRQFAERFGAGTINYQPPVTQVYGYDFLNHISAGGPFPSAPPSPAFIAAITNLQIILATQYPWIENVQYPDPIPSELLQPFGQFLVQNNLMALNDLLIGLMWVGGVGDYTAMPTLYALQNLRRGILNLFFNPLSGFTVNQGCSSIYQGISNYIGAQNIILNANVLEVKRASLDHVKLTYQVGNTISRTKCGKLIVAFPQLLNRLQFMDLSANETDVFKDVRTNLYYQMKLSIDGPAASGTLNIASLNLVNPAALLSTYPNMLAVIRNLPYGPAVAYAYNTVEVPESEMYSFCSNALDSLASNSGILNQADIDDFDLHLYQTHFTTESLAQSPTPYTKANALQGQLNTYYVGALFSYAETASIWEKTYQLITANFPQL